MIARDGEGASKLVTVEVAGARTPLDADRVARAIANSPLVKTALAGADPNWGRILCAAGYSGAKFDPNKVDVSVNDLALCRKGVDAGFDEAAAHRELEREGNFRCTWIFTPEGPQPGCGLVTSHGTTSISTHRTGAERYREVG